MKLKFLFITLLAVAISHVAFADDATAFELVKRGDKYVGVQSKDKVVQIRSERSIGTLTPNIWFVVYYDPDSTFKSVQVKFGAGEKMDVSHPWRILQMADNAHKVLDKDDLKVDSDKAIEIATSQPLLDHLKLKATKLTLGHSDNGPVWRVEIWASKLNNSNDDVSVGVVTLSAKNGSVIKLDLHPNSVK